MRQPVLGIVATVVCIVVSLAIVALFDPATFSTWVTLIVEAMIPGQIVLSLVWKSKYPGFAERLAQPVKGLVLAALMAVAGLVVAPIALLFVGGWVTPPDALRRALRHLQRGCRLLARYADAVLAYDGDYRTPAWRRGGYLVVVLYPVLPLLPDVFRVRFP